MNKMVFPDSQPRQGAHRESIDSMLINFVDYCKDQDFGNQEWVAEQKDLINDGHVIEANRYLKKIARTFNIRLSARRGSR